MAHYTKMIVVVFPTLRKAQAAMDEMLICGIQPRGVERYWRPVGTAVAEAMCDANRIRRRMGMWGRLLEGFMERDEKAHATDAAIVSLALKEEDIQVTLRILQDHDPVACHVDGRHVAMEDEADDFDLIFRAEMVDYLPPQVTMY